MSKFKKAFRFLFFGSIVIFTLVIGANYTIERATTGKTFHDVAAIPRNKVGLVLGTAKMLKNGYRNLYFTYRVNATAELYHANKIDFILVSGDNSRKGYDEPTDFEEALIAKGIPKEKIYLDYAGFRTFDSVIRAKKVFGLSQFTVISQEFHNERAIYLAEKNGISAIGFNAQDVSNRYGFKVKLREYLARTKVFIDVIVQTKPKYLGETIEIK